MNGRLVCAAAGLGIAVVMSGCGTVGKQAMEETQEQLRSLRREASLLRTQLSAAENKVKALAGKATSSETAMKDVMNVLKSSGINVTSRGASVVVTMASRVIFEAGQTDLQPEARTELIGLAQLLIERFPDRPIAVEGHADSSQTKRTSDTYATNWELSAARALAVLRCLVDDGKVAPERLSAVAYADTRPIADNSTPEGKAENRRVEIVVLPPIETAKVSATFE
jgi:chemotaxis protein MotB